MRFTRKITAVIFLITVVNYVLAQDLVNARFSSSCGYLAKKIYCFGGSNQPDTRMSSSIMNMLDISAYSGSTAEELSDKWVTITTSNNNIDVKKRDGPQSMTLPDGKTMLIIGGTFPDNDSPLVSQTLAFNRETQSWGSYESYEDNNFGPRQIRDGSSVYVPSYGVVLYGGVEYRSNKNFTYPGVNVTFFTNEFNSDYRNMGYTDLVMLDIRVVSTLWKSIEVAGHIHPVVFPKLQAAIYDTESDTIFYFGGAYVDTTNNTYTFYSFDKATTYNFTSGEWGMQAFKGQGPAPRYGHSATIVGPTQRHVLIYGGRNMKTQSPIPEYCYTLDLNSYQWTYQIISTANNISLARTEHSAVTINNNLLFVVFGRDFENSMTLDVIMLNVTHPSKITLLDKYIDPDITTISPLLPSSTSSTLSSSAPSAHLETSLNTDTALKPILSSEATIGVAVGASAAGLIGIASIIFYLVKKKNETRQKEESLVEVDWDAIEQKYMKAPTQFPPEEEHFKYFSQVPDGVSATGSKSVLDSLDPMIVHTGLRREIPDVIVNNTLQVADSLKLQKPDIL